VVLTLLILYMAVAETTLWGHYLVDRGEIISLVGLLFILVAGLVLHRSGRLFAALPLIVPWVVYPVVTQGDQLIDNLTINQMRLISHVILGILFAAPVAAVSVAAVALLSPAPGRGRAPRRWTVLLPGLRLIERGRVREGVHLLALFMTMIEIWIAHRYLGTLMIVTLVVPGVGLLFSASSSALRGERPAAPDPLRRRRVALGILLVSVIGSLALYLGFKNRPGAYQGSPHHLHDSSRGGAAFYPADRVAVPASAPGEPTERIAAETRLVLDGYGGALEKLFRAYHLMDRNYNYAFHNAEADRRLEGIAGELVEDGPLAAFLEDVRGYVAYNLDRARTLEEMTAEFEKRQAGLQHATHLYEGEGKILGARLVDLTSKHGALQRSGATAEIVDSFVRGAGRIREAYANRIVGF
jgi:hypothetical protein